MPLSPKSRPSKRVAWPEPGRPEGGEFRLTWGRLAGIIGTLAAIVSAFPAYWTVTDHWMNKAEIQQALKSDKDDLTKRLDQNSYDANVGRAWVYSGLTNVQSSVADIAVQLCRQSAKTADCRTQETAAARALQEAVDAKKQATDVTAKKP